MQPENSVKSVPEGGAPGVEPVRENIMAQGVPGCDAGGKDKKSNDGEKSKMSKKQIIGLVVLSLIAVGGVLFGVYGMNSQNEKIAELTTRATEAEEKVATLETETITIDDAGGMATEIVNDTDMGVADIWNNFSSKLLNQSTYVMGYYWHYNGSDNEQYVAYAIKDDNGHLIITDQRII